MTCKYCGDTGRQMNDMGEMIPCIHDPVKSSSNDETASLVAAIQFALTAEDGIEWLRYWNLGEFDICRREWAEAPDKCYKGADPLYKNSHA